VTDGVREFIKGEVRQETTEGITGSLVQQAMQAPSEHVITQQTTQSVSLVTDTTTGGSTMEYLRLHGKNAMDTLVTGGSFDRSGSYASLHVVDATETEVCQRQGHAGVYAWNRGFIDAANHHAIII
jgi:hypothetical protein